MSDLRHLSKNQNKTRLNAHTDLENFICFILSRISNFP